MKTFLIQYRDRSNNLCSCKVKTTSSRRARLIFDNHRDLGSFDIVSIKLLAK